MTSIVFLHGLNGNPQSTWENNDTRFYWPAQLRKDIPEARVMVYEYHVNFELAFSRNEITIEGIAQMFVSSIANKRSGEMVSPLNRDISIHSDSIINSNFGHLY